MRVVAPLPSGAASTGAGGCSCSQVMNDPAAVAEVATLVYMTCAPRDLYFW